jgi:predicted sulfurtransferase
MAPVANAAAYKFAALQNLVELRDELRGLTAELRLRGTILLSPEGVNLFVAGTRTAVDTLIARIQSIPGVGELDVKWSDSTEQPFNRMLVKVKKEIIAFGVPGIVPHQHTSPRVSPRELKQWLDEGRPVTLLDTRNNFEVAVGTFRGALPVGVDDFRDFPQAVNRLPEELRTRTVVTFCTGGIRCEKAAPYLETAAFADVYQLDGGILRYFEEVGGEHFDGECFVFDKRVAVNADLRESNLRQCYVCQAVLTVEEQASPHYLVGKSCPHCKGSRTVSSSPATVPR